MSDVNLTVGVSNVDEIAAKIGKAMTDAFGSVKAPLEDIQRNLKQIADVGFSDVNKETKDASQAFQDLQKNIDGVGEKIADLGTKTGEAGTKINEAVGQIGGVFENLDELFKNIDQKIAAVLNRIRELVNAGQTFGSSLGSALGAAGNTTSAFAFDIKNLNEQIATSKGSTEAFVAAYKNFFPAEIIKQLAAENKNLTAIQQQLNSEVQNLNKTDLQGLRLQFDTTERKIKELTQVGITSAVAQRQAEENASRERVATVRAESAERNRLIGQQVSQAQIAAKAESDAVRTSSQESIALAQSAAKQRVATFKLVAQAFQSTERLITRTFEITTNVLSTAFRGLVSIAETTTSSIASLFKRSGDKINNDFSQTMSSNETTLQNSVNQQQTIINNFVQNANRTLGNIGLGAAGGLLAGGALIGRALTGGFRRQALLEESERSLTILLGDAEKAVALKERTLDVVRGTPFSLDQFADAAAQLVAFNVDAEKVPRFLEAIADSAAVKGGNAAQSIDTLVRVFGQVTTTARISLTDINSIAGAGVPALDILGNAFGATADEMRDLISSGAIPAEDALDALTEGIINGTDGVNGATAAFGGLAKELGNTTRGALSNFDAALSRAGANVIEKFRPAIIAFVGLATQLVDAFGKVAANIAETIANSPIFRAIVSFAQTAAGAISSALKAADGAIKAFSDGLLLAASAFSALFVARRIPALLSAIQFAIARLLTPVNIAFVALTALGAFFSRLLEQSSGLRAALSSIGDAFRSAFEPIGNLVGRIIPALQESLGSLLTGALGGVTTFVLRFLLPAVESLANFLTGTVVPAVQNVAGNVAEFLQGAFATFVDFATTRLVPILVTAFGVVFDAIKRVVDFVQDTILPVVLPVLERFANFAVSAFTTVAEFVTGTLVPGIQRGFGIVVTEVTNFVGAVPGALREFVTNIRQAFSERSFRGVFDAFKTLLGNFTPIAAAAGLTVALAFINPFAALIAGLGVVAFAAFGSDIISVVRPQLQKVLDFVTGLFSGPNLQKIAVEFLKLVNEIGRIIGRIVFDPRVVGLAAALAATAITIAAAFVSGLVQGLVSRIPDLIRGFLTVLQKAIGAAINFLISDPGTVAKIALIFGSALLLGKMLGAGKLLGQKLGIGAAQGLQTTTAGFGGARSFVDALIGGEAAFRAQVNQRIDVLRSEVEKGRRILGALGGPVPGLGQGRTPGGQFGPTVQSEEANLRRVNKALQEQIQLYGAAAVGAQSIRVGFQRVFQSLGDGFRSTSNAIRGFLNTGQKDFAAVQTAGQIAARGIRQSFDQLRLGIRNVLDGISLSGKAILGAAGAAAGTAFSTAFLAQGLFKSDASVGERFSSVLGIAATFGASAAVLGPKAAAAAAGVGLLVGAIQSSGAAAAEARQKIDEYADEIAQFSDFSEVADFVSKEVDKIYGTFTTRQQKALREAGITKQDFSEVVKKSLRGDTEAYETFANETLQTLDGFGASFGQQVKDGLGRDFFKDLRKNTAQEVNETIDQILQIAEGAERAELIIAFRTEDAEEQLRNLELKAEAEIEFRGFRDVEIGADFARATDAALEALRQAQQIKLDSLAGELRTVQGELDTVRTKADLARQEFINLLRGEDFDLTETVNRGIVEIDRLGAGVANSLKEGGQAGNAQLQLELDKVAQTAGDLLVKSGAVDKRSAELALQPLLATASEVGGEAGDLIIERLERVIADLDLPEVVAQVGEIEGLDEEAERLQSDVNELEIKLTNLQIEFDEADIVGAATAAAELAGSAWQEFDFTPFSDQWASGIAAGITNGADVIKAANIEVFATTTAGLREYLETGSPSRLTARELGKPFAEGIAKGIDDSSAGVVSAGRNVGQDLVNGTIAGIDQRQSALYNRIRQLIDGAVRAAEDAARISSPSQEFRDRVGDPIVQGIILGIIDNEFDLYDTLDNLIIGLIGQLDDSLLEFRSTGNKVADEIGLGIADGGADVLGSISGIIGQVYNDSLSEAQLFKEVGQEIAAALFAGMATGAGGFGSAFEGAGLQLAFFDVIDSGIQFGESLAGIRENFELGANTFDIASEAGREAQRAFFAAGGDIRDYAQTLIEAGRPLSNVIGETQAWRDSLIEAARANGATNEQINEMILRLRLSDADLAAFAEQVKATQEAAQQAAAEAKRLREEEQKQREAEEKARRAYQERERREREEERKREEKEREKERERERKEREKERAEREAEREKEREEREKERAEREAEREAERLAREQERQERERERERERREKEEEERRRRETTLPPAAFENLIIQTPAGDPEAVALLIANRVAYSIRGT